MFANIIQYNYAHITLYTDPLYLPTSTELPHSPKTCSSVVMMVIPSEFTAEQVYVPVSSAMVLRRVRVLSCVLLSIWTVLMVTLGGAAWISAPL